MNDGVFILGVNSGRQEEYAIGSGYWRVVGEAQDLITLAEQLNQRWLKGIGTALRLQKQG